MILWPLLPCRGVVTLFWHEKRETVELWGQLQSLGLDVILKPNVVFGLFNYWIKRCQVSLGLVSVSNSPLTRYLNNFLAKKKQKDIWTIFDEGKKFQLVPTFHIIGIPWLVIFSKIMLRIMLMVNCDLLTNTLHKKLSKYLIGNDCKWWNNSIAFNKVRGRNTRDQPFIKKKNLNHAVSKS